MEVIISIVARKTPGIRSRVFRALADYGTITGNKVVSEDEESLTFQLAFQWREPAESGKSSELLSMIPGIVEVTETSGPLPDWTNSSSDSQNTVVTGTAGFPVMAAPERVIAPPNAKPKAPMAALAIGGVICALAGVAWIAVPKVDRRGPETTAAQGVSNPSTGIEAPVPVEPTPQGTQAQRPVPPGQQTPAQAQTSPSQRPAAPAPAAAAKPAPFVPPSRGAAPTAESPAIPAPPTVTMAQANPPAPVSSLPRVEQVQPQTPAPQAVEPPRASPPAATPAPQQPAPAQAPPQVPAAAAAPGAGGPKPLRRVEPSIPAAMKKSLKGDVTVSVKVYVGANGDVIDTVPMKQGDPLADQMAAVAATAVRKWQFEPAKQNGQTQASQTIVRFRISK